jgi:peptide/nickel transport system ATP-binding protein
VPILEVRDLSISFTQYTQGLNQQTHKVIHHLTLSIEPGEVFAVIGASGSGKSLLAHALLGILPSNASVTGRIIFDGEELSLGKIEQLRGKDIALIPQSVNYLNPLMRVGAQARLSVKAGDPASEQRKAFERYGLAPETDDLYPFQLSGGMARRVLTSTATLSGARLIIADEPTPGLDPAAVEEALCYFRELANQGCAVMMISHDIEAACTIANKVAVLYAGTIVEIANVEDFQGEGEQLRHPYTKALWKALPQNGFMPLAGDQPHSEDLPQGCVFAPRCGSAASECLQERPSVRELRGGTVRCLYAT